MPLVTVKTLTGMGGLGLLPVELFENRCDSGPSVLVATNGTPLIWFYIAAVEQMKIGEAPQPLLSTTVGGTPA